MSFVFWGGFFVACPEFKRLVTGNNSLQLEFEIKSEEQNLE